MNSALLIKLIGGLTAAAGIGTGGYFIKEHFSKSEEKKDTESASEVKNTPKLETPPQAQDTPKNPEGTDGTAGQTQQPKATDNTAGQDGKTEKGSPGTGAPASDPNTLQNSGNTNQPNTNQAAGDSQRTGSVDTPVRK